MTGAVRSPDWELLLSVAVATRISSVLAIFLGRLNRPFGTDTLDPKQGVEMRWGELIGETPSAELQRHLEDQLPSLKERISISGLPGAPVATAAIDVVSALLNRERSEPERFPRISGLSLGVAIEMDRAAAPLPDGHRSWAAFELRGQADLLDFVLATPDRTSAEFIYDLRMEAGAQSMTYRNGMKILGTESTG